MRDLLDLNKENRAFVERALRDLLRKPRRAYNVVGCSTTLAYRLAYKYRRQEGGQLLIYDPELRVFQACAVGGFLPIPIYVRQLLLRRFQGKEYETSGFGRNTHIWQGIEMEDIEGR